MFLRVPLSAECSADTSQPDSSVLLPSLLFALLLSTLAASPGGRRKSAQHPSSPQKTSLCGFIYLSSMRPGCSHCREYKTHLTFTTRIDNFCLSGVHCARSESFQCCFLAALDALICSGSASSLWRLITAARVTQSTRGRLRKLLNNFLHVFMVSFTTFPFLFVLENTTAMLLINRSQQGPVLLMQGQENGSKTK